MMMWLNMDRRLLGEMLLKIARRPADRPGPEAPSRGGQGLTSFGVVQSLPPDEIATAWKTRWIKL